MAFLILPACSNQLAIQGATTAGGLVTLQPANASNPSQLWDLVVQRNGAYYGFALVNPTNLLAITSNGSNQQVVVQPFGFGSNLPDAWSLLDTSGFVRFALAQSASWSLNDSGSQCKANDAILLWNDAAQNSLWSLQLVQ